MFLRSFIFICTLTLTLLLANCATTSRAQVDPATVEVAQLKNSQRSLQDKVSAISDNVEDLQSRINNVEKENEKNAASLQDDLRDMREAIVSLKRSRNAAIQETVDNVIAANAQELDRLNQKIAKVVTTVQEQNLKTSQQVISDITALQQDIKAVKLQLNASMDKTDRLERQIDSINAAGVTRTSHSNTRAASSTQRSTTAPTTDEEIVRTGVPSDTAIDYSRVYEHTIVKGETLWKIARDYEVSVQDIFNVNPKINSTTTLRPGQVIFVPYREK